MKCKLLYNEIQKGRFSVEDINSDSLIGAHVENCADCASLSSFLIRTTESAKSINSIEPKPFLYTRLMAKIENSNVSQPKQFRFDFVKLLAVVTIIVSITGGIFLGTVSSDKYFTSKQMEQEEVINQNFLFSDLATDSDELLTVLDSSE